MEPIKFIKYLNKQKQVDAFIDKTRPNTCGNI